MLTCPMCFQPLQSLVQLNMGYNSGFGSGIASFPSILQNLHSLRWLMLSVCGIRSLPVGMFTNTTQLRDLSLYGNAIQSWDPDVFTPLRRLRRLVLSHNQIVTPNVASFSKLTSLRWLRLGQNPFACNCDLLWFLEYTQKNGITIARYGPKNLYTCASPKSLRGVPILRTGLSPAACISHTDLVFILSTAAAIFLSAIVFALVYRGHWYICHYIFLIRSRRRRYLDRNEGNYVYDAFVAYNNHDRSWVTKQLLPRLETEGRYRLCLHQRDWLAGREISENIAESIEKSRKVIVVLSNSFPQSHWCRRELDMANHRRLILVLLETISAENQTATLRNLLTKHTYLEWNERAQETFWRVLKKALRRPKGAPPTQMRSVQGGTGPGRRG